MTLLTGTPYLVTITKEEFETSTGLVLDRLLLGDEGEVSIKTIKFLNDVAFYTFENAIYPAGDKRRVNAIITAYPEVVDQIKEVMFKVGEYMLSNGYPNADDNIAMRSGMEVLENGSIDVKDTQTIISKILPPNIMTYIMNIEPSIVYAGGLNV